MSGRPPKFRRLVTIDGSWTPHCVPLHFSFYWDGTSLDLFPLLKPKLGGDSIFKNRHSGVILSTSPQSPSQVVGLWT